MTNPTPFSPAAQAVLIAQTKERCLFEWSAVNDPPCHPSDPDWNGCVQCIDRRGIAAALRAAADRANPKVHIEDINYVHESYVDGWKDALDVILSIAAELEGAR